MSTQNFSNHKRIAHFTYYIGVFISFGIFIAGAIKLIKSCCCNSIPFYVPLFFSLIGLSVALVGYYTRSNALKAQDRAIRAEEQLRYYILTGKRMDVRLKMSQIVALRFASDEELEQLASRAVNENLDSKSIKQAIQNWRADYYRV